MNKRIRKKHRIKEFYEPYLIMKGEFNRELTSEEVDEFVDSVIDFCDENEIKFTCGSTCLKDFNYSFCGGYKYRDKLNDKKIGLIAFYILHHKYVYKHSVQSIILKSEEDELKYFGE